MPDRDPPQEMLNIEHPITNVKVNHTFAGRKRKALSFDRAFS